MRVGSAWRLVVRRAPPQVRERNAMSNEHWFWSQRGRTMGPVDLVELQRLVANGSIAAATWIYDPRLSAWVVAGSMRELFGAGRGAAAPPPPPPAAPPDGPADACFCRFCGARQVAGAIRCGACGRETGASSLTIEPRLAAIICRSCVLAAPVLNALSAIGPAIVWAIGSKDQRVVAEAKDALNQLLTLALLLLAIFVLGLVGILIVIGPILAAIASVAVAIYCIWAGIVGLVALHDGKPFRYPFSMKFIP